MTLKTGDRVRIRRLDDEYTGCRGTIAEDPAASAQGVLPLGYYVAVDGENGVAQPFLVADLEPLRPAAVRHPVTEQARQTGA
jgi:hypothetical protein